MKQVPSTRLESLDALRGLAALAVVFFHYTYKFPDFYPDAARPLFSFEYGLFGVHLFFMISGFVILMSLERSGGKGFVTSRFIRLYPAFWASASITHVGLSINSAIPYEISPAVFAANLTMLQDYMLLPSVDGVYWSLSYEIGFYIFLFSVFRAGLRRYVPHLPGVLAIFGAAFALVHPFIPHPLHYLLVFNSYSHLFAAGLALYLIRTRGAEPAWICVVAAAPLVQYLYDGWAGLIAIAACIALMTGATLYANAVSRSVPRFLVKLGAISYALYLTHQMLGYVLLSQLEKRGLDANAAIAVTTCAAILLASVLTYGFERPAARFLKARLRSGSMRLTKTREVTETARREHPTR